jgi:hypothetical protein
MVILEMEKKELEEKERRGKELGIVLGALEEKEKVRVKRIEDVRRMIYQLRYVSLQRWIIHVAYDVNRKKVEDAKLAGDLNVPRQRIQIHSKRLQWRPKYTKETVAVSI